jgi:hypothetical protein
MRDYEEQRMRAFAEYLAATDEDDPRVQHYRQRRSEASKDSPVKGLESEFNTLRELLATEWPWTAEEAQGFIVTGKAPIPPAINSRFTLQPHARYGSRGVVTVEAAPWVSAKVVARAYQDLQHRLLGHSLPSRSSPRCLAVYRFVSEHRRAANGKLPAPRLQDLMRLWNAEAPRGWRYTNVDRFRRDRQRGEQRVREPEYLTAWTRRVR